MLNQSSPVWPTGSDNERNRSNVSQQQFERPPRFGAVAAWGMQRESGVCETRSTKVAKRTNGMKGVAPLPLFVLFAPFRVVRAPSSIVPRAHTVTLYSGLLHLRQACFHKFCTGIRQILP